MVMPPVFIKGYLQKIKPGIYIKKDGVYEKASIRISKCVKLHSLLNQ
jgi:hypothetical protein